MNRLALIHGFGMPMAIFDPLIEQLNDYDCTNIALPGDFEPSKANHVDAYVDFISKQITAPTYLLGWSLGGMLALALTAQKPRFIKGLILVSSTPKFTQTNNWKYAIKPDDLSAFHQKMQTNYQKTIQQFLTLQTHQSDHQKVLIKMLIKSINLDPDYYALDIQLSLLQNLDLRDVIGRISIPALWLSGDTDTLCPAKASMVAASMMPNAKIHVFNRCGHLPFISHQSAFIKQLNTWIIAHE